MSGRKKIQKGHSDFKISAEEGFCQSHQNKYPVANISLKSVRGSDWEGCLLHLKRVISEAYQEHKYLLKSDKLEVFAGKEPFVFPAQ